MGIAVAQRLRRGLIDAYPDWAMIEGVVRPHLALADVDRAGAPSVVWTRVLDALCLARQLRAFVEALRADQNCAALHGPIDAVLNYGATGMTTDLSMVLLPDGRPFLNRGGLRAALREVGAWSALAPILVVGGPARTGKSETRYLIYEMLGSDKWAFVDQDRASTVGAAMQFIWKRFGNTDPLPPAGNQTEDAWYSVFWDELHNHCEKTKQRGWLVFDDLGPDANGQPRVESAVLALIHQLAVRLGDPAAAARFRLVLLDYPSQLPTRVKKGLVQRDMSAPISDEDLTAFVCHKLDAARANYTADEVAGYVKSLRTDAEAALAAGTWDGLNEALQQTLRMWRVGRVA